MLFVLTFKHQPMPSDTNMSNTLIQQNPTSVFIAACLLVHCEMALVDWYIFT